MKGLSPWALVGLSALSAVLGHEEHGEVPLHERPFVQDSPEELERKWSFEVSGVGCCFLVMWLLEKGGRVDYLSFYFSCLECRGLDELAKWLLIDTG